MKIFCGVTNAKFQTKEGGISDDERFVELKLCHEEQKPTNENEDIEWKYLIDSYHIILNHDGALHLRDYLNNEVLPFLEPQS